MTFFLIRYKLSWCHIESRTSFFVNPLELFQMAVRDREVAATFVSASQNKTSGREI